jgi:ADP-heptose:LPS heptosyltransferase
MGDIVISTVVIDILKQGDPEIQIDYLCENGFETIMKNNSAITNLYLLKRSTVDSASEKRLLVADASDVPRMNSYNCIKSLRENRYDLGVDLLFNPRSALHIMLSRCKQTIGGDKSWRKYFYTENASYSNNESVACRCPGIIGENLSFLGPLKHGKDRKQFWDWFSDNIKTQLVPSISSKLKVKQDNSIVIIPGSTWADKEWQIESWYKLVEEIADTFNVTIKVISPPAGIGKYFPLGQINRCELLKPLPLSEVLAVIDSSKLVISVDGGLMHSSIALNKPTIGLLGPTSADTWFPYQNAGPFIVHGGDQKLALHDIDVKTVMSSVVNLIGAGN